MNNRIGERDTRFYFVSSLLYTPINRYETARKRVYEFHPERASSETGILPVRERIGACNNNHRV